MADVSHLEKMGRELKCPICLSLLNSAVSLTCNHVFCNSCIEKSMKSASNCPVCKVPYRRREIRPAPHMDNLVSVYKSMEMASGVNIYVTQNAVSTKISGEDNQIGDNFCKAQYNGDAQRVNPESGNHKQVQREGSIRALMTNQRSLGSNLAKPSFPTKKRVQVPLYPTSETQMRPEELDSRIGGNDRNKPENVHVLQKDMSSIGEKRKLEFSPFFWLREEVDLEKSSQQTDGDQEMYTPPEVPSFSDIKESDDDAPCEMSPKRGSDILLNTADFIDSEMFEWTQRPCSPELCSSSLAIQTEDIIEHNRAERKGEAALTEPTKGLMLSPKKRQARGKRNSKTAVNNDGTKMSNGTEPTKGLMLSPKKKQARGKRNSKTAVNNDGTKMSNGKVGDAIETRKTKRTKKTLSDVTVHADPETVTNQDMLEKSGDINKMLSTGRKMRKNKTISSEGLANKRAAEKAFGPSDGTDNLSNNNKTASVDLSASQNFKKRSNRSSLLKKSCKSANITKRLNAQREKVVGKAKVGKYVTVNDHMNREQADEVLISNPNHDLLPLGNHNEVSDREMTTKMREGNSKKMSKYPKKVKFSMEGVSKGNFVGLPMSADADSAVTGQTFVETEGTKDQSGMKASTTMDKGAPTLSGSVLRKCKTFPSAIHCAFCHSSEESEASGVMVHYFDGKLVSDSNKARSNAVYMHKYCTEWAPNVYFEDENVINLENELSRSRRIKCSLCGKKGAALGCYEKSCRKSFHVPCARLTPGCRWDYENFVMLCPIHASCQLPNEITKSQSTQKRKHTAESKSHNDHIKATCEMKSSSVSPWKAQKRFKNLVLCCSALTNTEKDIVYEFQKLSGVTIVKNWDSSVTHVIASTDENGACRRTLKFLMGVLEGKWILSVQWLKACMEAVQLVDEQSYEISVDVHGIRNGPRLGRLRLLNKQTKLFDGHKFFFVGHFAPSYKGYLHDLVIAAGGKVLNRKPVEEGNLANVSSRPTATFIIYSVELPDKCSPSKASSLLNTKRADAEAVASSAESLVATSSWILNSIAGYKLQPIGE